MTLHAIEEDQQFPTIRETVASSMDRAGISGYATYADPVIADLTEREHQICDNLIEFATSQGLSQDAAEAALSEAGLSVRPAPEPEPVTTDGDDDGGLTRLLHEMKDLVGRVESALRR